MLFGHRRGAKGWLERPSRIGQVEESKARNGAWSRAGDLRDTGSRETTTSGVSGPIRDEIVKLERRQAVARHKSLNYKAIWELVEPEGKDEDNRNQHGR